MYGDPFWFGLCYCISVFDWLMSGKLFVVSNFEIDIASDLTRDVGMLLRRWRVCSTLELREVG